jgi:hypothetical protein
MSTDGLEEAIVADCDHPQVVARHLNAKKRRQLSAAGAFPVRRRHDHIPDLCFMCFMCFLLVMPVVPFMPVPILLDEAP